jgi:hypothetical protein
MTSPISPEQIRAEVDHICEILHQHCITELILSYGWACHIDHDELWRNRPVATTDLPDFVDRAISAGIYIPGNSDLFISDSAQRFQFLLCHESDIHFKTESPRLFDSVRSEWLARGYTGYEKNTDVDTWRPLTSGPV